MKLIFEKTVFAKRIFLIFLPLSILFSFGCVAPTPNTNAVTNANTNTNTNVAVSNTAANLPDASSVNKQSAPTMPVTLPVLDAMFSDKSFADDLKSKLQLTDEQIDKLKVISHQSVAGLKESAGDNYNGSTRASLDQANKQIREVLGDDKASKLFELVSERWSGGGNGENAKNSTDNSPGGAASKPGSVPTDTRIVVNAPEYRMDVFQDGKLVKTYKVGIGYPEFPLPTGLRRAKEIIFNPTWTPPDEPWVEASNKVEAGKKVAAGDKLNPLGPIKIPIGLPSLIHGGKTPARLGTFASHGCVGLTDSQVQDFALELANISGTHLNQDDVKNYEKVKTETKNVNLDKPITVELRYETIVVEDGKLKIFRDVYEHGTNTEENLRRVLEAYGVSFDSLAHDQREKILSGLKQMAFDAQGNPVNSPANSNANANANRTSSANSKSKNGDSTPEKVNITRNIKGKKEVDFELAELKGKGYPAPVAMIQK